MLEQFFKALKNLFGFNNGKHEPAKRKFRDHRDDYECDISTDEEEFEYDTPLKRRRISQEPGAMADRVRPRKNFGDLYYITKPGESFSRKKHEYSQLSGLIPIRKYSDDTTIKPLTDVDSRLTSQRLFDNSVKPEKSFFRPTATSFLIKRSTAKPANRVTIINDSDCIIINGNSTPAEQKFREKIRPKRTSQHSAIVERVNGSNSVKKSQATCDHECHLHRRPLQNNSKKLTVTQCIQLEEKEKYRQLLSKYTTPSPHIAPVIPAQESPTHSDNSSTSASNFNRTLTKHRLNYSEYQQQKEKILQSIKKQPDAEQNTKTLSDRSMGHSVVSGSSNINSISSDDAIITKVEPPRWKKMSIDCVENPYNSKWLENWRRQLSVDRQEKSRLIEEAEKKVRKPPWSKTLDDLQENIREQLTIAEKEVEIIEEKFLIKDTNEEVVEEDEEPMPELTPEMEDLIDEALRPHPPDEVISHGFRLQIRRRDMETLQDLNWLNDEVINFYMNLLMERGKLSNMPSVYACNTFFYPKLLSGGHAALSRWTRKINIFSNDIMLVPVHLGVHWCLAVVDFRKKAIKYYDSMGGKNNECLNALCNYLQAESLEKRHQSLDVKDWSLENVTDAPQQMNSSDCGMFACKYAEYITRNAKITFKQNHMPYFRRRMVYEILKTRLL